MDKTYPHYAHNPRVASLLHRGWGDKWMESPAETLSEDIPDLIRMACDPDLFFSQEENEWMASTFACRELGKLKAAEAVLPLLQLLRRPWYEYDGWDDVRSEEFPRVLSLIGAPAISPIGNFLRNSSIPEYGLAAASVALERIVKLDQETHEECRIALTNALALYSQHTPTVNACLIAALAEIKAVASIETIRAAYNSQRVDLEINGDIEDIEIEFGLREERATPSPLRHLSSHPNGSLYQDDSVYYPVLEPIRSGEKTGRNDPCPCGSGKKYKKCCLGKQS